MAASHYGGLVLGLRLSRHACQRWTVSRSVVYTVCGTVLWSFPMDSSFLYLHGDSVFPVHMMTPTWVFPAYPLLLTAPLASNLLDAATRSGQTLKQDPAALAFGAITTQGTGCLIAFMISAAFIYRLMTQKLPKDMQRPGVVGFRHARIYYSSF
jgi:tellurite resistance protein TehA-like permease